MNIKLYQAFIETIDNKTMSKAAEKLYTSQPNISLMIKELETFYDTQLFYREHNQLTLTPKGRLLEKHARSFLHSYQTMNQKMKLEKPIIRIGSTVTVSQFLLHDYLLDIKEIDNEHELNIVVNNTSRIEELILNNQLDFAFVEGEIQNPKIKQVQVKKDELIPIIGSNFKLDDKILKIEQLKKLPWVRREQGSQERNQYEKVLKNMNIAPNVVYRSTNLNNVIQAVIDNYGFAIISKIAADEFIEKKLIKPLPIKDYQCHRSIRLIYIHDHPIISNFLKYQGINNPKYTGT